MDNARIYVDFNEMVTSNIVLLSKDDAKMDSEGNSITLYDRMPIRVYMDDVSESGETDNLIAEGIAIKYDLSNYPYWCHVKWCCEINEKGIIHESDIE